MCSRADEVDCISTCELSGIRRWVPFLMDLGETWFATKPKKAVVPNNVRAHTMLSTSFLLLISFSFFLNYTFAPWMDFS